jgi:hypothetical protein
MQAFAIIRFQIRLVGLLVMPGLVAAARLHSRKNAHCARMLPALGQNRFHPILLPETLSAPHKFDLDPVIGRDSLHVFAKRLAQWLGPLWVVENSDLVLVNVVSHPAGIAPPRYGLLDDDPVVAAENPSDLIFIPVC